MVLIGAVSPVNSLSLLVKIEDVRALILIRRQPEMRRCC